MHEFFSVDDTETFARVSATIRAYGLTPIRIAPSSGGHDDKDWLEVVDCTPEEFLDISKSLGVTVIFVRIHVVAEDEFIFSWIDEEPSGYLTEAVSQLHEFEDCVGVPREIDLLASNASCNMRMSVTADWFPELKRLLDEAYSILRDQALKEGKEERTKQATEIDVKIRQALEPLAQSPEFARLSSQKAMLAWIRIHVAELRDVSDTKLLTQIQILRAQLQATRTKPMFGERILFENH